MGFLTRSLLNVSLSTEARFRTASGVRPIFSAISLGDLQAIISRARAASSSAVHVCFLSFMATFIRITAGDWIGRCALLAGQRPTPVARAPAMTTNRRGQPSFRLAEPS